jgi:glycosyltransferase involved in cell wall biosynthesis
VLNKTIDTDALRRDLDSISDDEVAAYSRAQGLTPGRTALFLGGVDRAKGIGFLLEAAVAAEKRVPGFVLLVGGAGAQLDDVRAAQRAGAPVRVLGRLDGRAKALALRSADVLAIPEWIGLVAVDSLVASRPIVSTKHPSHSPEHEYLEAGVTAVFAPHDPRAYANTLTDLMVDAKRLLAMRDACTLAAPRYSLDHMVDSFVEGVVAWDEIRRARL